jgi:ParB/RepB/Spo0J family partition protein
MSEDQAVTQTSEPADEFGPLDDVRYFGNEMRDLAVDDIYEANNMRTGALNITQLLSSIRQGGVIAPVAVRQTPQGAAHELPFELIAGHRRLASYRALDLPLIPAVILDATDEQVLVARMAENLQREDANPIDEARVMQQMIQLFDWTQSRVAKELGVVPSQVSKRLSLLALPDRVISLVAEGDLTGSHAEELTSLSSPEAQEEMADIAVRSRASVAQLSRYVRKVQADQVAHEAHTASDESVLELEAAQAIPVPDQHTPLDMASPELATALPYLRPRSTLTEGMRSRMELFMLLRASNDVEALRYLEEIDGVTRRTLWAWVMRQPQPEVHRLIAVMIERWYMAGHRFATFSADMIAALGEATDTEKDPLWGMPGHEALLPPLDEL